MLSREYRCQGKINPDQTMFSSLMHAKELISAAAFGPAGSNALRSVIGDAAELSSHSVHKRPLDSFDQTPSGTHVPVSRIAQIHAAWAHVSSKVATTKPLTLDPAPGSRSIKSASSSGGRPLLAPRPEYSKLGSRLTDEDVVMLRCDDCEEKLPCLIDVRAEDLLPRTQRCALRRRPTHC